MLGQRSTHFSTRLVFEFIGSGFNLDQHGGEADEALTYLISMKWEPQQEEEEEEDHETDEEGGGGPQVILGGGLGVGNSVRRSMQPHSDSSSALILFSSNTPPLPLPCKRWIRSQRKGLLCASSLWRGRAGCAL